MKTIQLPVEFVKTEQIVGSMIVVGQKIIYQTPISLQYTVETLEGEQGYLVGWNNDGAYHAFTIEDDDTAEPVLPSHAQHLPLRLVNEPETVRAVVALGMILSLADYQ